LGIPRQVKAPPYARYASTTGLYLVCTDLWTGATIWGAIESLQKLRDAVCGAARAGVVFELRYTGWRRVPVREILTELPD